MIRPVIQTVRRGKSIPTAGEDDFTVNTIRNQLKIFESDIDEVELPASAGGGGRTFVSIQHNLGYKPFVMAWARGEGDVNGSNEPVWKRIPATLVGISAPAIYGALTQGENETLLVFYTLNDPATPAYSAQTIQYRYVIYLDPSQDAWDS